MSALAHQRRGGMVTTRRILPRGTVGHHFDWSGCREQIGPLHQCKWNWLNACGYGDLPSDTHGTPRSNRRDSHSLQESSAGWHVTGRSTRHMERRDHVGCFEMDYTNWLDIQHHKRTSLTETYPCTCHTLACLASRCTLLLRQYGHNSCLQQNLDMKKKISIVQPQPIHELLIDRLVPGWGGGLESVCFSVILEGSRYVPQRPRSKHFPIHLGTPDSVKKYLCCWKWTCQWFVNFENCTL